MKKLITIGIALAMLATMILPVTVMAANTGTQNASTSQSTSINIVAKEAETSVTSITFPEAAAGTTVSTPYNDTETENPQVLSESESEPVVRLKNGSAGTLNVTLEITDWTNGIVTAEDYELVTTGSDNISVVDNQLSADGLANSVDTGFSITADGYGDLYLEITLSSSSAISGTSTLTILGES